MKKIVSFAVVLLAVCGMAGAQRAAEYDLATHHGDNASYNRIGVSYNNTGLMLNDDAKDDWEMKNFSLNGVGIDYIHGFSLSKAYPMFLEVGANVNFNFASPKLYEEDDYVEKMKMQDINMQVPVNFVYRFNVGDDFSIAPYVGLNFKLHLMTQGKFVAEEDGEKEESEWLNYFSKDDVGEDDTWNRFQMGWHVGVGFQYSKVFLGLQYGTDFIPAWSYKEDDWNAKINTGNFKLTLGYTF